MVRDGVDREVAPGEVLLERHAVGHDRVAAIRDDVAPEGGHLVDHPEAVEHAHRPVLLPDRRGAAEQRRDLRRRGGRGEIIVRVGVAEQRVAERPAHAPGFVARFLQRASDLEHLVRYRRGDGSAHPRP